jgi:hypothetical protein
MRNGAAERFRVIYYRERERVGNAQDQLLSQLI